MGSRKGADAPAPAAPAPAPVPVSLAAQESARGTIKKATRKFEDVEGVPRVMLPDGRIGTVQREVRSDNSRGPSMLSILRPGAGDPNAGTRTSLADAQALYDALYASGVVLFTPPE